MTNFATFIDTGNGKAPIAQRGKAKQKRCDLRLVGLGLVVTWDGGIPLTWYAYPGDRPDVTAPGPSHAHRNHGRPGEARPGLQPRPLRLETLKAWMTGRPDRCVMRRKQQCHR
ncbi:MAG TPA: hypothetical protein VGI96_13855 [Streptosporangiaceae bacterium]|jgi:hypothetical protein